MKTIWAVIVMALLTACGGGGAGSLTADTTDVANLPAGVLRLAIGTPDGSSSKTVGSAVPSTYLRVVISNAKLSLNGQAFRVIQDTVPDAPLNFTAPTGTGYTVEAIGYNTDSKTGLHTVVSYAIARNVTVDADGAAPAVLEFVPVAAAVVLPPSVLQGARYSALANLSTAAGRSVTPLQTSWFLNTPRTTSFAPFVNNTSMTTFASSHFYTAPLTSGVPTTLYFQGVFTIKPTLIKSAESPKQWVFNATETSLPVTAPINLIIQLPYF